jgi:hypothetical protein
VKYGLARWLLVCLVGLGALQGCRHEHAYRPRAVEICPAEAQEYIPTGECEKFGGAWHCKPEFRCKQETVKVGDANR